MRGDGEAELHPEARAVRLGAALAALELRRQHGDSASGVSLDSALAGANERAVRLGTWLETARFAAAARDSAYFAGSAARAVARSAITIDGRADTEYAARQFQQVISVRPHDWAAIATSVEELLRRLGSR
jgi:hypothetical protein